MPAPANDDARARLTASLQLLNDVLAHSPIAGRYWVTGGLLLGWAREGAILGHDCDDVDFYYRADDTDRLLASFPLLEDAGFRLSLRFPGAYGDATEYSFRRDGAKFEFFRAELAGSELSYWNYGFAPTGPVANEARIPAQPLEQFYFLGRSWLKARNHDAEMTAMYGDWRTPDPDFDYLRGPAIVATKPWDPSSFNLIG
ncbi:MAG TPA: hypothetical protein VGF91_29275 [Solirubrobacteraceae bacterium]|jgi:hypothetical protein